MAAPNVPSVVLDNAVDTADHVSAIDFINRVNWLFDAWDIDAMVEAFLPDGVTHHTHGTVRGRIETRRFFQAQYPYTVPGVSRHATNPIVDPDGDDGVVVRYHNLLIRYAAEASSPKIVQGQVVTSHADMPALWVYSAMTDRLRRTEHGWRIFERRVGPTSMNDRLTPGASNSGYMDPYLSPAAAW
ncbi:nuclear transport factor 2 family protein [Mycobacterium sp.]|uniref:nuclear transport factor 2 family protein n=1 Tax=Mycobacterium sp. TaxID=1785 RepID=UPI003C75E7DA